MKSGYIQRVFFMVSKVFVHLTHLKLPQISQTYLKIFVWLEHLMKIHPEYYKDINFLGIFNYFTKMFYFKLSMKVPSKKCLVNFSTKSYDNYLIYITEMVKILLK